MRKNLVTDIINGLKPIRKNTIEAIRKHTSKFIFSDKNGNCKCERCGGEFILADHKHKSSAVCPKCHRSFEVWRTDIKSLNNDRKDWEVIAEAINGTTIILRYVLVYRKGNEVMEIGERARHLLDFNGRKDHYFENRFGNGWVIGTRNYFRESGMGCYTMNSWCCRGANEYDADKFIAEVKKLDGMEYLDVKALWNPRHYVTQFVSMWERADLYEKMMKSGLTSIVMAYQHTYRLPQYSANETELTKMLGISKKDLAFLQEHPSIDNLTTLQHQNHQLTEDEYKALTIGMLGVMHRCIEKYGLKTYNYLVKNGIQYDDYDSYILKIAKLGYPLENIYRFPREFDKAYDRVKAEEVEKAKYIDEHRDELIAKIKEGLYAKPELKNLFDGQDGFWVDVPSCDEDFVVEGRNNFNCVGRNHNYSNKVANGESLIFFIKKALDDKSYVTMEYCNGSIAQLFYRENKAVEKDSNVYQFATRLAEVLRKVA